MKSASNLLNLFLLFLLLTAICQPISAQDKSSIVKSAIELKRFIFKAQKVLPVSGAVRQLQGESYDVKVIGDSLISYLPFFGRAYSAPLNSNEGGIKFTSVSFDYLVRNARKGGWQILIKPKNNNDLREFLLTIGENGNARLQAISNNRQTVSFDGYVEAIK